MPVGASNNEGSDMEIKAGDVVVLKSSGPLMTVAWVRGDEAKCEWFDAKNEPQARVYDLVVLRPRNQQ